MTIRVGMLFGNKIKELRESCKLLQRQIAIILGIDVPMYSRVECGERRAKKGFLTNPKCQNRRLVTLMVCGYNLLSNS